MSSKTEHHKDIMVGGIKIKFPCKPYPSQLSMMSRIVKGLQNGNHCLLESPTGSGKSLALLCSALAWQEDMQRKFNEENTLQNVDNTVCGDASNLSMDSACDFETSSECKNASESTNTSPKNAKVPTIWFGTRTHKQISQITHELARTAYKHVNMTILSSREHSCIHPINEKSKNKNEGCRDLLKGKHSDLPGSRCAFYQNVHRMRTHSNLYSCGLTSAWDLEDLVKLGRQVRACPYYSTRELKNTASIVFCPYNYLIDPGIRSQMGINVSGQILIFDEAHNIEDSARDAASNTVNEMELINVIADLDHLIADGIKLDEHQPLHLLCTKIGHWLQKCSTDLDETAYETWSKVWLGKDFISCLNEWGITADTLPILQKSFKDALETDKDGEETEQHPPVLHSASQELLGGLFHVLSYLLYAERQFANDYRITVIRQAEYGIPPPKRTREGWISMSKRVSKYFAVNLHFWCLNPGVAFSDLASTHSIILTSGTLSPMSSFSSELGLSFPIQLEASHVIADSQVWVGSVGVGPNGHHLQATYQNTNALNFQDELGNVIRSVCDIVPFGVLCFFSSYKILEKLSERWQNTGLWNEISQKKAILCEPHGKNKSNFQDVMQTFYDHISSVGDEDGGLTGALLLAVCRGKISEGLDFSDNNARAVITVGIPFPNFKDRQVELKRKYNDQHCKSRGLLSGSDWYEIQAFRALNQALGRCIRHKNDWGALIIVDDRFCKNPRRYCKGLSKWVRQKVKTYGTFPSVVESLTSFCEVQSSGIRTSTENPPNGESFSCLNSSSNASCFDDFHNSSLPPNSFKLQSNSNSFKIGSSTVAHSDCNPSSLTKFEASEATRPNTKKKLSGGGGNIHFETFPRFKPKDQGFYENVSRERTDLKKAAIQHAVTSIVLDNIAPQKDDGIETFSVSSTVDIIVPSTQEKKDITIIPESPEKIDDDFDQTPWTKRKTFSGKKDTVEKHLAKRCKQSIDFTTMEDKVATDKVSDVFSENCVVKDDSQELFAPRTRKRRSLKASRNEKSQVHINTSFQNEIVNMQSISCFSCNKHLFFSKDLLKPLDHSFSYVKSTFPDALTVFVLSELPEENTLQKTVSIEHDVTVDTIWSQSDKLALQFYHCSGCKCQIAFYVMNSKRHAKFHVMSSKILTNDCT